MNKIISPTFKHQDIFTQHKLDTSKSLQNFELQRSQTCKQSFIFQPEQKKPQSMNNKSLINTSHSINKNTQSFKETFLQLKKNNEYIKLRELQLSQSNVFNDQDKHLQNEQREYKLRLQYLQKPKQQIKIMFNEQIPYPIMNLTMDSYSFEKVLKQSQNIKQKHFYKTKFQKNKSPFFEEQNTSIKSKHQQQSSLFNGGLSKYYNKVQSKTSATNTSTILPASLTWDQHDSSIYHSIAKREKQEANQEKNNISQIICLNNQQLPSPLTCTEKKIIKPPLQEINNYTLRIDERAPSFNINQFKSICQYNGYKVTINNKQQLNQTFQLKGENEMANIQQIIKTLETHENKVSVIQDQRPSPISYQSLHLRKKRI